MNLDVLRSENLTSFITFAPFSKFVKKETALNLFTLTFGYYLIPQ